MMSSFLRPFSFGLLALAFIGAGCSSGGLYGTCVQETLWGSCIDHQGIDPALLGIWHLESQTLDTPPGTITNPFAGRTLEFKLESFTLIDDITGEETEVADLQYFENWASEVSVNAPGCLVSGTSGGTWNTLGAVNFDTNPPTPYYELEINTDPSNPSVVCEGADEPVKSNAASTPLGVGPGSVPQPDGFAQSHYSYSISGGTLTITNDDSIIINTYVFQR